MGILKFIIRRLLFGLLTLVIIAFSVFALSQLLASDPAQVYLGRDARPESLAAIRTRFGLDKPKLEQFWDWFYQLFLRFNPGESFSGEAIWGFMKDRIVNSLFLEWDGGVRPLDGGPDPDDFDGWARWSGTSFSSPVVAGALAREMIVSGCTAREAVARVVDAPWLLRLPGLGTVVDTV